MATSASLAITSAVRGVLVTGAARGFPLGAEGVAGVEGLEGFEGDSGGGEGGEAGGVGGCAAAGGGPSITRNEASGIQWSPTFNQICPSLLKTRRVGLRMTPALYSPITSPEFLGWAKMLAPPASLALFWDRSGFRLGYV